MEIKKYIEIGERKAGKQIELARILGTRDSTLRLAKLGKKGLHDAICIKLADYIEVDRLEVIAASNLVTEKDEERRKIFESCFNHAASVTIAAFVVSMLSFAPNSPVHAASSPQLANNINYQHCSRRKKFRRKSDYLSDFFYKLLNAFQHANSNAH